MTSRLLQKSEDGGTTWRTIVEHVENVAHGVDLFANQGRTATALPSLCKVITISVWSDANPNDRISAELANLGDLRAKHLTPNVAGC